MSNPVTVLIADDESLVRQGVRHLLSRHGEFQIVAEASNGQEAIEMARAHQPQIVLMDVRMPVLNGLEALAEILKINPAVKAVILSGHSDFKYAQQALKLGACDYMLKPTDLPGLVAVLQRLINTIHEEERELQKEEKLQTKLNYSMSAFMEQFYWELLGNELLPEEIEEKMRILEIADRTATVLAVHYDHCYQLKTNLSPEEYQTACLRLKTSLQEYLSMGRDNVPPVLQNDEDCFSIIYFASFQPAPESFAARLKEWLRGKIESSVTIAIGSEQPLFQLEKSYQEARFFLKQRTIVGADQIITAGVDFQESKLHYPVELEKELIKTIRFGDGEGVKTLLGKMFAILERGALSPDSWRQLCFELLELGFNCARDLNIPLEHSLHPLEKGNEVTGLTTVSDIRLWLEKYLVEVTTKVLGTKSEPSLAIKKAMSYIDEHFTENLTLSSLAARIGLSPNYLSQIFKQETGKTFLEYLTGRRIEEAKQLLKKGDFNVSEVAFKVGYENPRYFSELFHKQEHVTPGQYRKSVQ